jgi:hypothetical protein
MKKALLLGLFAASVLAGGCESTPTTATAGKDDGDVITGSRIPRKGGSSDAVGTIGQDAYKQDRGTGNR